MWVRVWVRIKLYQVCKCLSCNVSASIAYNILPVFTSLNSLVTSSMLFCRQLQRHWRFTLVLRWGWARGTRSTAERTQAGCWRRGWWWRFWKAPTERASDGESLYPRRKNHSCPSTVPNHLQNRLIIIVVIIIQCILLFTSLHNRDRNLVSTQ